MHSTYVNDDERAAGGSTIIMRDNILHNSVNLTSYLHAAASDENTISCTVYIPPNSSIKPTQLKITDQLPTSFIIIGDFNGNNPHAVVNNLSQMQETLKLSLPKGVAMICFSLYF